MKRSLLIVMMGVLLNLTGCASSMHVGSSLYRVNPVNPVVQVAPVQSGWAYTTGDPILSDWAYVGPYHLQPYYPFGRRVIYTSPGWFGYW